MKFILMSLIIAVIAASASASDECHDPNEYYTDCFPFPECYRSCYFMNPPGCDNHECDGDLRGCVCQEDYVRDNQGYCVHYTHCPA